MNSLTCARTRRNPRPVYEHEHEHVHDMGRSFVLVHVLVLVNGAGVEPQNVHRQNPLTP